MTRDEYLNLSGMWLVETCHVRDLAIATAKCFSHEYRLPKGNDWKDGPFLSSWKDRSLLGAALPLTLKTSVEFAKAAEITYGPNPGEHESGKVPLEFIEGNGPRIDAILARNGIIVQFELWKGFVQPLGYPINAKQAGKFAFKEAFEKQLLIDLVTRRNELTHEPNPKNDPTCREFVEYAHGCRCLAIQASL